MSGRGLNDSPGPRRSKSMVQWHHCAVGATGTVRGVLRNILGNSRWETYSRHTGRNSMPLGLRGGPGPGTDARGPQSIRPLLIVLVLSVIVFGTIYGLLFLAASQTRNDVRRVVQEQCGLSSTAAAGKLSIYGGTAEVPYVDSTGAHTAIVYMGLRRTYFLHTCGR